MSIECMHGQLARSCERCADACVMEELRARIAELEAERDADRKREYGYSQETVNALTSERDALLARAEKAEAERDDALVAVKAMHKLLDRDWAIVDRDITLRCESHDQAWNYLHEMRDLVRAALENVVPHKEPQP